MHCIILQPDLYHFMARTIQESELIMNEDGSVYHLHLKPEDIGELIILVGDPDRVAQVSIHFDTIDTKKQKREFITHTGRIGKKRLSVISTGIGTDNIDIVFNELDTLVNIDLESRLVKTNQISLPIIRIGTSGSLQYDVKVDDILLSSYGLGLDSLMLYYEYDRDLQTANILNEITKQLDLIDIRPYLFKAPGKLADYFDFEVKHGITATCCGFYGPQGRVLRSGARFNDLIVRLNQIKLDSMQITNFEMETAAIYGMATLLGHRALSVNAILANRLEHRFSSNGLATIEKAIKMVLDKVEQIS